MTEPYLSPDNPHDKKPNLDTIELIHQLSEEDLPRYLQEHFALSRETFITLLELEYLDTQLAEAVVDRWILYDSKSQSPNDIVRRYQVIREVNRDSKFAIKLLAEYCPGVFPDNDLDTLSPFMTNVLTTTGIDRNTAESLITAWGKNRYFKEHPDRSTKEYQAFAYLGIRLQRVLELEKMRPGSIQRLHKEFGVINFETLQVESWDWILKGLDVKEKPYLLVIGADDDWNAANLLSSSLDDNILRLQRLGVPVRIIGAGDKLALAKRLARLRRYGHQMIQGVVFIAHGNTDNIRLSKNHRINIQDIITYARDPWKRSLYSKKAFFLFTSCKAGNKISPHASKAFMTTVVASAQDARLSSFKIGRDPITKQLRISQVRFVAEKDGRNSTTRHYQGRRLHWPYPPITNPPRY